mmetsp:Transcript_46199/g.83199  ORF Transcript_46199/g.83199 Transcript_46199/m.83199 type:complete len:319 (-) Transcript_46199:234-1190(-)
MQLQRTRSLRFSCEDRSGSQHPNGGSCSSIQVGPSAVSCGDSMQPPRAPLRSALKGSRGRQSLDEAKSKRCRSCPGMMLLSSDRSKHGLDLPSRWHSFAMPNALRNDKLKERVDLHLLQLPKTALVHVLFCICDVDGDLHLSSEELKPLAELSDFQGPETEWTEVYKKLCASICVNPSIGIDLAAFESLFAPESVPSSAWPSFMPAQGRLSCTENELRQMLRKLAAGPGSVCTTGPKINKILAETLRTAATARWSRKHCDAGHLLQWRCLKFHEGRVNDSFCRLCERTISRREGRYSCKQCHYAVCKSCRAEQNEEAA